MISRTIHPNLLDPYSTSFENLELDKRKILYASIMTASIQPSIGRESSQPEVLLLEQAQRTLESLHYLEQAALYHAASSALQNAISLAESGDSSALVAWLDQNERTIACNSLPPTLTASTTCPPDRTSSSGTAPTPPSHRSNLSSESVIGETFSSPSGTATWERTASTQDHVSNSPWEDMVRGAEERAKKSVNLPEASTENLYGNSEMAAGTSTTVDFANVNDCSDKADLIKLDDSEPDRESPEQSPLPTLDLSSLSNVTQPHQLHQKILSPSFWVSFLLHVVFLLVLSAILIVQVSKPERVAIVSAPFESEHILLETPSETSESLEEVAERSSPPVPSLPEFRESFDSSSLIASDMNTTPISAPSDTGATSLTNGLSGAAGMLSGRNLTAGAEFFGVKATGNTFIYVVDCSPSMARDGAFEAARQELIRSLMSMKPKQRFSIHFFGKEIESLSLRTGTEEEYPVNAIPENVRSAVSWLGRISIQKDGRPPNEALSKAISMQPDGIFLLFDGDTRADVAKHLRQVNRSEDILSEGDPKVPIHVVHFFQEEFATPMKKVAVENAGTYRFVPRPDRSKKGTR